MLKEQNDEISELKKQIAELEKVRPAAEVQKIKHQFSGKDPFVQLLDEFKTLNREFPRIVRDTLYKEYCGKEAWTPNLQEAPDAWDNAVSAEERKLLCISGSKEEGFEICCDNEHPLIENAKDKLREMTEFARKSAAKSDFLQTFNENHKYRFDLKNSDFWSDYLRR